MKYYTRLPMQQYGRSMRGHGGWLFGVLLGLALALPQASLGQWLTPLGYHWGSDPIDNDYMLRAARLTATRYAVVGRSQHRVGTQTIERPFINFSDAAGAEISHHLIQMPGSRFEGVALAAANGDYYGSGVGFDSAATVGQFLARFDSLGNVRWWRFYDRRIGAHHNYVYSVPGGAFTVGTRSIPLVQAPTNFRSLLRRNTSKSNLRWERTFGLFTLGTALAPLPDGAYVLVNSHPFRQPGTLLSRRNYDHWLVKVTPQGDSLISIFVADSTRFYDEASQVIPTTDGGLVILGICETNPAGMDRIRGVFIKLDSTWHEQWRWMLPSPLGYDTRISCAQELANGHFLIAGKDISGFIAELMPPASPDSTARRLWQWQSPTTRQSGVGSPLAWDYATNGRIRLMGGGTRANGQSADTWQCVVNGAPAPVSVNLCALPPQTDSLARWNTMPGVPADSLRFMWDSATFRPGPRYAEISQVEWDFGDGTEPAEGWTVTHRFASPNPVRVRVCARNNLGCEVCQEVFPLGPLSIQQELLARVSVYPNPSSGRFTVRGADGATLEVTDALGRRVLAAGSPAPAEAGLDLSRFPAGVYTLRLQWPDGRATIRRLVRW